jgi:hypothetical protein
MTALRSLLMLSVSVPGVCWSADSRQIPSKSPHEAASARERPPEARDVPLEESRPPEPPRATGGASRRIPSKPPGAGQSRAADPMPQERSSPPPAPGMAPER